MVVQYKPSPRTYKEFAMTGLLSEIAEPSEPIRVLVVDDHDMVRRGLAIFLETFSDLRLVGEANSGPEAVRLSAGLQPDVILMDLLMPDGSGIDATRIIRQNWPNIQVLALTSYEDPELVRRALQARIGVSTIPQIFVGGEFIGGASETLDAWRSGALSAALLGAGVEIGAEPDDPSRFLPKWLQPRTAA